MFLFANWRSHLPLVVAAERKRVWLRGCASCASRTRAAAIRYSYGLPTAAIARAFLALLGLPTVTFEDAPAAYLAIRMLERGVEFADALHLAGSAAAERFVTSDANLVKLARKDSPVPVVLA